MMPLEGRSASILGVSVVTMVISLITVCCRCFVRLRLLKTFGWDDALMVVAMVIGLISLACFAWGDWFIHSSQARWLINTQVLDIFLTVCAITGSMEGVGRHLKEFSSLVEIRRAMLWWWLGQCIYIWASGVAKVSIALALLRLSVQKVQRILLLTVVGASTCISLVFWFFMLLQCHPVSEFWERRGTGKCLSTDFLVDMAYLYSSICAVCDFVLGLLPIFLVSQLQISTKTKVALGATLSLGCLASTAVIIRIPCLQSYKDMDFLYSTFTIDIWSFIEVGLGITAGSLVTLRPLFRQALDDTPRRGAKKSRGSILLSSLTEQCRTGQNPEETGGWHQQPDGTQTITTVITAFRRDLNTSPLTPTFGVEWRNGRAVGIKRSIQVTEEQV